MSIGSEETQPVEVSQEVVAIKSTIAKLEKNGLRGVSHVDDTGKEWAGYPELGLLNLAEKPYSISGGHVIISQTEDGGLQVSGGSSFLGTEAMDVDHPAWETLQISLDGRVIKKVHGYSSGYAEYKDEPANGREYSPSESKEIIKSLQKIADNE